MRKFFRLFAFLPLVFMSCLPAKKESSRVIKVAYLYSDISERSRLRKKTVVEAFSAPGFELAVREAGLSKDDQVAGLTELVASDSDYIIMEPCSEFGFEGVLKELESKKKSVIFAESGVSGKFDKLYVSRIGPDYVREGREMVGNVRSVLERKNMSASAVNFAVVQGLSSVYPHARRYDGIMAAASECVNWNFVARCTSGFSKNKAFNSAREILERHPETNLMFVLSEDDAHAVLKAVESLGLKAGRDVFIAVFGVSSKSSSALASGNFLCVSASNPGYGEEIRNTVLLVDKGSCISKEIFVPTEFFSISDAVHFRDVVDY